MPDLAAPILVPPKLIITWSGLLADIPIGWVLCDGNNGTPNLIAKFVRGAPDGDDSGVTGGEDTHVLTEAELANHDHSFSESTHSHITHDFPPLDSQSGWDNQTRDFVGPFTVGSNTSGVTIDGAGGGASHENKPSYFELAYIMKT